MINTTQINICKGKVVKKIVRLALFENLQTFAQHL